MTHIFLASKSPRRREILDFFSFGVTMVDSVFDETSHPFSGDPREYALALAQGKNQGAKQPSGDAFVLAADTIVYREGTIYHKPASEKALRETLSELQGRWHSVFTSVSLAKNGEVHTAVEETRVLLNTLTPYQIDHYCKKIQWIDKAGGYAIQMGGGLVVNRIEGCYYNVMGLPLNTLHELLRRWNIELWEYVK